MLERNGLQRSTMLFVKEWANTQKTPVPKQEIIKYLISQKVKECSADNVIRVLLRKGYIRRACSENRLIALYVMKINI